MDISTNSITARIRATYLISTLYNLDRITDRITDKITDRVTGGEEDEGSGSSRFEDQRAV